jgi:hypothetical protein
MPFTPPLSSWLNLVERFIKDGAGTIGGASFASVRELADTTSAFVCSNSLNLSDSFSIR